jgi:hypothetical protein
VGLGKLIAATAPSLVPVNATPGPSATTPSRAVSVLATRGRYAVRLDPARVSPTLVTFEPGNPLVSGVGLSGLEPLTSALSGPARPRENGGFTLNKRP